MVDVIYSSDNLTVLGGPEILDVNVDIGPAGTRGGLFFTGNKEVSNLDINADFPTTPLLFDFYILTDSSSENYLKVYQYVLENETLTWKESFDLNNKYFYLNKVVSFALGEASIEINLSELGMDKLPFTENTNSFSYFNVQATISNIDVTVAPDGAGLNHNPCALSIQLGDAYEDTSGGQVANEFPFKLPINLTAVEYSGGIWSPVDEKDVVVYFAISLADPNEIISNLTGGGS